MSHEPNRVWTTEVPVLEAPELLIIARSMIAARKALSGPMPVEVIHDPVLDLMLNLFEARTTGERMDADELMRRTTVSKSGAQRWIAVLVDYGWADAADAHVCLTADGVDVVTRTLEAVARSQWQFTDSPE